MSGSTYLIAIALIQQDEKRLMPIGGKSLKQPIATGKLPNEEGEKISLELLLRVFERSEEAMLKVANGNKSIFLLEMPLELIQEVLPKLKEEWLNNGNTELLISKLMQACDKIWNINFIKGTGIRYDPIKDNSD